MTDAIKPTMSVTDIMKPPSATAGRPEQFGKDTFLKLLVAQLRYQDPTSPTDGAEFLAQTAQFTVVEKLEELAKTNAELLSAERMTTATSLIGRTVSYTNSEGKEATGVVTGMKTSPLGPVLKVGSDEVQVGSVTGVNAGTTQS
jgi:flagellar basal-body rod modification protein FlgD